MLPLSDAPKLFMPTFRDIGKGLPQRHSDLAGAYFHFRSGSFLLSTILMGCSLVSAPQISHFAISIRCCLGQKEARPRYSEGPGFRRVCLSFHKHRRPRPQKGFRLPANHTHCPNDQRTIRASHSRVVSLVRGPSPSRCGYGLVVQDLCRREKTVWRNPAGEPNAINNIQNQGAQDPANPVNPAVDAQARKNFKRQRSHRPGLGFRY
jgi:hypothetical protein